MDRLNSLNKCNILMRLNVIKRIKEKQEGNIYPVYNSPEHVQHYKIFSKITELTSGTSLIFRKS